MDDRELQNLLRNEGERLTPGPMPDLVGKGRADRRRRIGGISAVAAVLVGIVSVAGAQAFGNADGGSVSVADSPSTSVESSAQAQDVGCPSGVISTTDIDTGFLEPVGYKSLTALGMSLDDWPSGVSSVTTVEVLEETKDEARLLLSGGDNNQVKAVAHAALTGAGWTTTFIELCQ